MKHALRSLARTPGFTVVALLTLALGIGLNTAMFNIVNSLALQPLAFPESENLFRLERVNEQQQRAGGHRPSHFVEIARATEDFARVACFRPWSFTLAEPGRPAEILDSLRVSPGFFSILGLKMALGREFWPEEDTPGRNQVIILSHAFWLSHFNGDPDVVGRTLRLDGSPNEIVGVASALANDPRIFDSARIYRPLALHPGEIADRVDHAYSIIGRYLPGVTTAQVEPRLSAITANLAASDPKEYEGRSLQAVSLNPGLQGTGRKIIFMLISLSGFVLMIACANLANLLLARTSARSREFAIRGALGASRAQLIRPLATECLVLAVGGGFLGVLVCLWTNDWMAHQLNSGGPALVFAFDWRLLFFAFGITLIAALFFGVGPAWATSRVLINETLKSGTRSSTGDRSQNRFRQILIVGQFALALVLLSGAVTFVRGLDQLLRREAGWNSDSLLQGILSLPSPRYPDTDSMMRLYERVQQRVTTIPGVTSAAISHSLPISGFPSGRGFLIDGEPPPSPGNIPGAPINGVTPDYFDTVGTRLLRGRDFLPTDRSTSPRVIILNETMARTLFPDTEAIGRRLAYFDEQEPQWMEIIGIVQDVKFISVGNSPSPFQAYVPLAQATWSYVSLVVRSEVPSSTLIEPIRRAVGELDPDMAIKELMPVAETIEGFVRDLRAVNQLLIAFALLGLFLAALGIYGVVSRLVAQRTNEIGIRMALGAQMVDVARLILGAGMRMAIIGTLVGLAGAVALARFLSSTMAELSDNSPTTIAVATVALIAIALLSCWLPARRAANIDPIETLRTE